MLALLPHPETPTPTYPYTLAQGHGHHPILEENMNQAGSLQLVTAVAHIGQHSVPGDEAPEPRASGGHLIDIWGGDGISGAIKGGEFATQG